MALSLSSEHPLSGKATKRPQTVAPTTSTDSSSSTYSNNYQDLYGNKFGGKIWDGIESNANPDKLDGYLGELVDGGTSKLGELLNENASPEDAALAMQASGLIQSELGGDLKTWLSDSNLSEGVFDYLGENPLQTGLLGVGALAAFIASDPAVEGDFDFNLTDKTQLSLGGDAGSLFDLGMREARAGITHTDGNQQYGVKGSYNFDTDLSRLSAFYNSNDGDGTSFEANAFLTDQGNRNTAGGDLSYLTPTYGLTGGMNYDSDHPEFGEYGQFRANAFSRGEGPSKWNVGGSMDTEGAYRLEGGYNWANENTSVGINGFTGQDASGRNDTGLMATFSRKF